jgi:hypothetical protein
VSAIAEHPYLATLAGHFGGSMDGGCHNPNGVGCALEIASVARGIDWTDRPATVGLPDIRPINDSSRWESREARAEAIAPVIVALWGWSDWPAERRQAWAERVAERTIREILPIAQRAAGLDAEADRCERDGDRAAANAAAAAAKAAAYAAAYAANADAAAAAKDAAKAAAYAANADAAAYAAAAAKAAAYAADDVLRLACRIWIEAAS